MEYAYTVVSTNEVRRKSANMGRPKRAAPWADESPPPRKKPGRKPKATIEPEQKQNLCVRCVSYVFTVGHLKEACDRESKACSNCALNKRACIPVPSKFCTQVDELLSVNKDYSSISNVRMREAAAQEMFDLANALADNIADYEMTTQKASENPMG